MIEVNASYGAINAARDICWPWVGQWDGDEWGESMSALFKAAHTSYGLSDEDCAVLATMLVRNIIAQKAWVDAEGHAYDFWVPEDVERTQAKCRESRNYWLNGGNLEDDATKAEAKAVIDQLPDWMFG